MHENCTCQHNIEAFSNSEADPLLQEYKKNRGGMESGWPAARVNELLWTIVHFSFFSPQWPKECAYLTVTEVSYNPGPQGEPQIAVSEGAFASCGTAPNPHPTHPPSFVTFLPLKLFPDSMLLWSDVLWPPHWHVSVLALSPTCPESSPVLHSSRQLPGY